jgi:acyl dehydratase
LIGSGWLTTAVLMRMQCDAFLLDSTCVGSPGVDEIRWLVPVRPGDTLSGFAEVIESRPSRSRPDRGAVFCAVALSNQDGDVVMTLKTRAIFMKRGLHGDTGG